MYNIVHVYTKVEEGPRPCTLGEWETWSFCSESCGGGQIARSREVLAPLLVL